MADYWMTQFPAQAFGSACEVRGYLGELLTGRQRLSLLVFVMSCRCIYLAVLYACKQVFLKLG